VFKLLSELQEYGHPPEELMKAVQGTLGDAGLGLGPGFGAGGKELKDPLAGLLGQDDGSGGVPPSMDKLFEGLANMYGGVNTSAGGQG